MRSTGLLIDGDWVSGEETFESIDPATGESIGTVEKASNADVETAVEAAEEALPAWSDHSVGERSELLSNAVEILLDEYGGEGEETELKQLITNEVGRRPPESDIEVAESADMLSYFAEKGPEILSDELLDLNDELWPTKRSRIVYEPVGVVGVIKPWNYPLELPVWAIGAALVAGNTVVFKPSKHSSMVGAKLGRIFDEAGFPDGVVNVVTGDEKTGAHLVESNVDMISFTGSKSAGVEISKRCAEEVRPYTLELGGNDAAIVTPDVDLELAANGLVWGCYCNTGQVCVRPKRVFVHESILDDLLARIEERTDRLRVGEDLGPLVSEQQLERVHEQVTRTVEEGATLVRGGKRADDEDGFYYRPTILTDVTNDMTVMENECFGPVMPIAPIQSVEEGVERANESSYGLGASVWTDDTDAGEELAEELDAGMVWVNDVNVAFPQAPWGGVKESGIGVELGRHGIEEYANVKHVNVEQSDENDRDWWFPY